MSIFLSDEEIFEAQKYKAGTTTFDRTGRNVAKAQLKRVVEWGDEECRDPKHDCPANLGHRRECTQCWQALLKEAE